MSEASEDVQEERALTPREHLESILYQFVNLYERWSEDRQIAAKQGADIAKFVKVFSEQVTNFESIEEEVRGDITNSIEIAAKNMAISVGRSIGDAAIKEVEPTVRKLKDAAHEASNILSRYQATHELSQWTIIAVTVFSTVLASLLIVKFLMPTPVLPLTEQQMQIYELGKTFSGVWPTLSKEKQKWFLNTAAEKGKINAK